MTKLRLLSIKEVQDLLDDVESSKAAKRLMVALAYKDGVSVDGLADRYEFAQSTIYYRLDRLDTESIESELYEDPGPR